MSKMAVISHHTSRQRDSWWYLVQDKNGALYVEHVDDLDPTKALTRWPINDFILTVSRSNHPLQDLIDRMFD